jgi:hypothetical protein
MVCREKDGASRKRAGETLEPKNSKRPRFEPARPRWIEQAQPQISRATTTVEVLEETVAEAGGHGEAWAEAWATTSPK